MRNFIELLDNIVLLEGGNIWKNELSTKRINKEDVLTTIKFLEQITGLSLRNNLLGSTGLKPSSGDIDVAVDTSKINKEELQKKLDQWANKNDKTALTKKSGVSVHFRTPINGNPDNGYVQTDFMFVDDIPFAKWSMSAPISKFRGDHKHIVLASVAKALGLRWSFLNGLSSRLTGNPLRGGKDPDYVAKTLFGEKANKSTISSVENMLASLENDPDKEKKLADARVTLAKELADYENGLKK